MKLTFSYLAGRRHYGQLFQKGDQKWLRASGKSAIMRASFDVDENENCDKRSVTRNIIRYIGFPLASVFHKHNAVSFSISEVDCRAIANVFQRSIYATNLSQTITQLKAKLIFETNNHPALHMIKSIGSTTHSKFIDIQHHYIKFKINENIISMVHVKSKYQDADIFNSPIGKLNFETNRHMKGLVRM